MGNLRFEGKLVGMHFRPPAKDVVNMLPSGAVLEARRQPDNPYDVNAIQVLLPGFCEGGQHGTLYQQQVASIKEEMSITDETLADETEVAVKEEFAERMSALQDPLFLGFICNGVKTGGKVADTIAPQMDGCEMTSVLAKLSFNEKGEPMVVVEASFNPPDVVREAEAEKAPE